MTEAKTVHKRRPPQVVCGGSWTSLIRFTILHFVEDILDGVDGFAVAANLVVQVRAG